MITLASAQSGKPLPVAIYYGWPSLVNGAKGNLDRAAEAFGAYRILVFGDGIEMASHPDHHNVALLIPKLTRGMVFGYICIGVTQKLSIDELQNRALAWKGLGARGIFLDEAGNDFGVSHARREAIIEFAHRVGLAVFVNAFQPADVFAEGTHLRDGDFYLLESFAVRMGERDTSMQARSRQQQALEYRRRYKVGLVGVTTTTGTFSPSLFQEACTLADKTSLDGFGWGEPLFSSISNTLSTGALCGYARLAGGSQTETIATPKRGTP